MKFLFVLAQLELHLYVICMKQNALSELYDTVVLFTTSIENLRLSSSAEAGIVRNLFLYFEHK